jgi:alpha-1,3-glucan synthase
MLDLPIEITIQGMEQLVMVHLYSTGRVTYVLLDAPVFRARHSSEPYPPRMDDIESAVYYSTWNQSIAAIIRRYQPDVYHINDYHGAAAPLYLLPDTIPCCLSLHNAEFQGLWSLKEDDELESMSTIFNLDVSIVNRYIRFGDVFNLLHAGVSYLRDHQDGSGVVGVSDKYSQR